MGSNIYGLLHGELSDTEEQVWCTVNSRLFTGINRFPRALAGGQHPVELRYDDAANIGYGVVRLSRLRATRIGGEKRRCRNIYTRIACPNRPRCSHSNTPMLAQLRPRNIPLNGRNQTLTCRLGSRQMLTRRHYPVQIPSNERSVRSIPSICRLNTISRIEWGLKSGSGQAIRIRI